MTGGLGSGGGWMAGWLVLKKKKKEEEEKKKKKGAQERRNGWEGLFSVGRTNEPLRAVAGRRV